MNFMHLDGDKINLDASKYAVEKRMCELSFVEYIKQAWHVIEPGQEYKHNWHIDAIADHLTAITDEMMIDDERYYNRLLINVPPGAMKSLLCNVLWPSWEWGPRDMAYLRYVCASHNVDLAIRDSTKMRRLIQSEWYQERWGDRVVLTGDQNAKTKFETTSSGFRQAIAMTSITGSRGDRVIIDDPHSVNSANSEAERTTVTETFERAIPTRLNNPDKSAIVVIMQRLHEEDVSGIIIEKQMGYDHIMIPMEYDPDRAAPTMLGWEDPRSEKGELMFPNRFPKFVVDRDKKIMGTYAASGQFQQLPTPEDGGIIKRKHWKLWEEPQYPPFDYIIASLDTAYTEKTENDPSALTVWGIWTDDPKTHATRMLGKDGHLQQITRTYDEREVPPRIMLMHAWQEHLEMPELIAKVSESCLRWKVSRLLIENKSVGMPVARELRRMYSGKNFGVQLEDPGSVDKMSRLYSVQHLFEEGLVYCPDKAWADEVISQCMRFPKAKHDDLCLVGDTMILMADGSEKRIDSIRVGDQVRTPNGTGTVSASAKTGIKPIWELIHTNGILRGTANHPVMCDGEYKPLSSCDVNGKLVTPYQHKGVTSWHLENKKIQEQKPLSSMGSDTIVTQNQKTKRTNAILEELGIYCTAIFGSFITGLFQKAIKSITLTAIRPITILPIWIACQERFTGKNTMMNMSPEEKKIHNYSISNIYSHERKNGMEVMKVVNGIEEMPSQASGLQMRPNPIARAIMWAYANGAVLASKLKALKKPCVQADVLKKNQNTSEVFSVNAMNIMLPVYNLTIDGEHCYYANGILTHNCDTVSMAMRYLRRSGFILRTDEVAQDYEDSRHHVGRAPEPLYGA